MSPSSTSPLTVAESPLSAYSFTRSRDGQIAAALGVGEETIKTHVSRVLAKLGVRDRIHAVVYAHKHGLVPPLGHY
ncbi:response regulator transcription factor [Nocardia sp. CA-135953]|uniref:response regulator transcription factor n=1 Tax=Nocardia sp. CA-135953 TaxID=3239978 RepID=UPI003D970DBE